MIAAAEPVVTVKKSERFCAQTFSRSGGNHQKMPPKASSVDFHGSGGFHRLPLPQLSFFFASFFFLCKSVDASYPPA